MKTRTFAVFGTLCLLLLMLGCTKKKSPERVVFDDWWNLDYLKNACAAQAQAGRHCSQSADEILWQAENTLQVAFSSEPDCHDVQLIRFTSAMANAAAQNPNAPATGAMKEAAKDNQWSLMLDLPGDNYRDGEWTMVRGSVVLKGNLADSARVVRQVCAIAKGEGGSIAN